MITGTSKPQGVENAEFTLAARCMIMTRNPADLFYMQHRPAIYFIVVLLMLLPLAEAQNDVVLQAPAATIGQQPEQAVTIEAIERRIASIARQHGEYASELFEPLLTLGRAYAEIGDIDQAGEFFDRAQHITHRNEGVYSPKQFEILEIKTTLALRSGEPLKADKLQQFLFFIAGHHFEDLDVVPAYLDIGKWYMETGQYRRSRKVLGEVVTLIQKSAGDHDLRLLQPMQLIAKSRRLQGACCTEKYLIKVLDIIEHNDDVPADTRAAAYAELADAYTVAGKSGKAATYYSLASQIVGSGVQQEPRMIAMSRTLNKTRRQYTQSFRPEYDLFARRHPMRRMSLEEQLEAAYQPPQRFILALNENNYDVKIKDVLESRGDSEPSQRMVGKPFQFIYRQLKTILPGRLQNEASLTSITIALNFTVTAAGSIRDIEFTSSNAPVKLNRLMKEVIRKTRFRPAIVDGQPVITHNVKLTQSFASNQK